MKEKAFQEFLTTAFDYATATPLSDVAVRALVQEGESAHWLLQREGKPDVVVTVSLPPKEWQSRVEHLDKITR